MREASEGEPIAGAPPHIVLTRTETGAPNTVLCLKDGAERTLLGVVQPLDIIEAMIAEHAHPDIPGVGKYDLVPTDELVDALKARFDHLIFAGLKVGGTQRNDEQHSTWKGHTAFGAWLAMDMIRGMQDWEREPEAPTP